MHHQKETPAIAVAGAEEIPDSPAYFIGNQTDRVTNKPPVFWAKRYALNRFNVLPLHWIDGGRCSCGTGCKSLGKHPISEIAPHGVHSATKSLQTIGDWFLRYPNANIGVAIPEGLVAFDVDPRNGGSTDSLPDGWQGTLHAKSGGGGWHVLYQLPQGRKVRSLGRGIDIKAAGGYLAAEPSMHASGRAYEWQDWSPLDDVEPTILELPEAFLEPLKAASAPVVDTPAREDGWDASEAFLGLSVGRQKLIAEGVPEGGRSDAFHGLVCGLADDGLDALQIEAILSLHPTGIGHKYSGRLGTEIARCLGKRREPDPIGAAGVGKEDNSWLAALMNYQPPLQSWREPPPVRWAVEGLIREGTVGALIAPGATGKTTLLITLGICHALGQPFLGRSVKQGGFLLLSLDDSQEDLDAAVGEVINAQRLSEREVLDVAAFLRVISLQGKKGPRSFNRPGLPGAPNAQMQEVLEVACAAVPDLVGVSVDTLRQFAGGPTNAEEVIMQVYSICAAVSTCTGAYFAITHHTGKQGAREDAGDMYAGSGSAAIADNARFVLVLAEEKDRATLARIDLKTQGNQAHGKETVLCLGSRRGSIRHQAQKDVLIVRRGFLLEAAAIQEAGDARTLQILDAIAAEVDAGRKPSKNAVFKAIGGNRNTVFAEIDELIECGLVAGQPSTKDDAVDETGIKSGINKALAAEGLTIAGRAFLNSRQTP
jgi:hypothetical protein